MFRLLFALIHQMTAQYPVLDGLLMDPSSGDAIVLLEDFNAHTDNEATWSGVIGRNCLPAEWCSAGGRMCK